MKNPMDGTEDSITHQAWIEHDLTYKGMQKPKHTHQWVYVGKAYEGTSISTGHRFICPDCEEVKVVGEK